MGTGDSGSDDRKDCAAEARSSRDWVWEGDVILPLLLLLPPAFVGEESEFVEEERETRGRGRERAEGAPFASWQTKKEKPIPRPRIEHALVVLFGAPIDLISALRALNRSSLGPERARTIAVDKQVPAIHLERTIPSLLR